MVQFVSVARVTAYPRHTVHAPCVITLYRPNCVTVRTIQGLHSPQQRLLGRCGSGRCRYFWQHDRQEDQDSQSTNHGVLFACSCAAFITIGTSMRKSNGTSKLKVIFPSTTPSPSFAWRKSLPIIVYSCDD